MNASHRGALGVAAAALAIVGFVCASSRDARAQDRTGTFTARHHNYETPQHFAFELRFGPYKPDIDSDPALGGHRPYQEIFGTTPRLMMGVELDWQAVRIPYLGTLGPGLSASFTSASAAAPLKNPTDPSKPLSGEQTTLSIYPIFALAVLRADVLMREARVPLVPYAKVGVGYALWRASNDNGTSNSGNVAGKGHSLGTQIALGLALHLNQFDEYTAKNFDTQMGVNHTYVFFEYFVSDFSTIGSSDQLRVGSSSWVLGLAFEF